MGRQQMATDGKHKSNTKASVHSPARQQTTSKTNKQLTKQEQIKAKATQTLIIHYLFFVLAALSTIRYSL